MGLLVLLAEAAEKGDPLSRPEVIYGTLGLAVALLAGAGVIYFVDKWRKRAETVTDADAVDSLTTYREMYEQGEITEAEYQELRRRVAEKVKAPVPKPDASVPAQPAERQTVNPPTPPPKPAEPPPPT